MELCVDVEHLGPREADGVRVRAVDIPDHRRAHNQSPLRCLGGSSGMAGSSGARLPQHPLGTWLSQTHCGAVPSWTWDRPLRPGHSSSSYRWWGARGMKEEDTTGCGLSRGSCSWEVVVFFAEGFPAVSRQKGLPEFLLVTASFRKQRRKEEEDLTAGGRRLLRLLVLDWPLL